MVISGIGMFASDFYSVYNDTLGFMINRIKYAIAADPNPITVHIGEFLEPLTVIFSVLQLSVQHQIKCFLTL
jgi:hypothetical protein